MAAIPEGATLPQQQQDVGGLPSIHSPSPTTTFGALAEGAQAVGEGVQKLSDVYANHAMQVAALNNKAMSDVAYTNYLSDAGKIEADFQIANRNVDPANAATVYQTYVGQIEQLRQHYRGTLGNMMAQSTFDQDSRRMQGYMIMNGSKTVAAGVHSFRENAFNGSQTTLAAQAAAATDPAQQEDLKQQIANGAYAHGAAEGLPEDAIRADILQRTSAVDVSIIDQMLRTNPEGAMTYYRAHKAEMTPQHQGALQEQLDSALTLHGAVYSAQAGMAVAGQATTVPVAPAGTPTEHGGLTASMSAMEAGIIQAFPGTRATSEGRTPGQNAAAHGAANSAHMSGNAVDFHIPPGMTGEEFAAQIKAKFPGANVLYEGPNAAHSTAPHVHVQLGTEGMRGAAPSGYMAGTPGAQLDAIQGNARNIFATTDAAATAYARQWGLDPVMVRYQAEQKVESDMNRMEFQFRQQEDASRQNLLAAITEAGPNGEPAGDLPTLFAHNPGLQGDYNNLTGSDRRMVQGALRGNANQLTPQRQQTWANTQGMDSATFLQQNPLDPNLDLTTSQRMQMIAQQKTLRQQAARQQEHDAKLSTITSNRIIHRGMMDAGLIDTNGQVSNPQDYQAFLGRMLQSEQGWLAAHPAHKGPIPDQEMINMATPLLAARGVHPDIQIITPFGGLPIPFTGSAGTRPPIIPPDRYQALHDQYMATHPGQGEPSPEQIGAAFEYRRQRGLER